jgi:hypothetical protein
MQDRRVKNPGEGIGFFIGLFNAFWITGVLAGLFLLALFGDWLA